MMVNGDYKFVHLMSSRWKIYRFSSATFALILIGLSLIQLSLVYASELDSGAPDGDLDDIADVDKDDDLDDLPPPPASPPKSSNNSTRFKNEIIGLMPDKIDSSNNPDSILSRGLMRQESNNPRISPFGVFSESSPNPNKPSYPTVEFERMSVSRPTQPIVFSQVLSKKIELLHQKLLDQIVD